MEYWEFLIQREGDRGWRSIKTGNLQLTEGKYRIVANSHLLDTQIQSRVTHQTLGSTVPQRRSQSRNHTTNSKGLLIIIPFTYLHSGIWQFVCSGATAEQSAWHQILKLRVLPRISTLAPDLNSQQTLQLNQGATSSSTTIAHQESARDIPNRTLGNRTRTQLSTIAASQFPPVEEDEDTGAPTAPIAPISMQSEPESWATGLDRLLEQIERDSLQAQPRQPVMRQTLPGVIQLHEIAETPSQLISLNRSTFSGMIPGTHLTIVGTCNLQRLNANLVQTVKIEKMSICLRHPQTSEIIASIERSLPSDFDTFTFSGQLALPTEPKISLLLGEVNLYDKHHIQLGSSGFTVTLNLSPQHESELSLLQMFERNKDTTAATLDRLTQELQLEAVTMGAADSFSQAARSKNRSTILPLNPDDVSPDPMISVANQQDAFLCQHPDIQPVAASIDRHPSPEEAQVTPDSNPRLQPQHPNPTHPLTLDITGDLEIDFDRVPIVGRSPLAHCHSNTRNYPNLEIVVDD
jgi:hypothetical protein